MGKTGPTRKRADARRVRRSTSGGVTEDFYDAQILALLWGKVPVTQRKKILDEVMTEGLDRSVDQQAVQLLLEEVHTAFHEANPGKGKEG